MPASLKRGHRSQSRTSLYLFSQNFVVRERSTVLLADINRDGPVVLGNGRGGFTLAPTKSLSQDFGPGYVALVDLNKDGALDLISRH
jgi:hypothetical protein